MTVAHTQTALSAILLKVNNTLLWCKWKSSGHQISSMGSAWASAILCVTYEAALPKPWPTV